MDLTHVEWKDAPNSVTIKKPNGEIIDMEVGNFISIRDSLSGKEVFFKIDAFYGSENDIGPISFDYREVDTKNKCFFETPFCFKMGSKTFIICYPSGISKYGYHLNNDEWSSIVICKKDDIENLYNCY